MDVETAVKPVVLASAFIFDQYVKATVTSEWQVGFVTFERVANTGASFGLLQGYNAALFAAGIIILGTVYWYRESLPSWGAWLILIGGSSNLVDRVVYGHVVDYVNVGWWPVFNVADAMLTVGVSLILYDELMAGS